MVDAAAVDALRVQMVETARALLRGGLVSGTAGNLSARLPGGGVLLSPAAHPYETLRPEDLVVVAPDGTPREGIRPPTSELALHLACLRRHPEIGAVIHTHSRYATMFAMARRAIPCAIEEFGLQVGGAVPVARYRPAGSAGLGMEVARHLAERSAVLMANHGLLSVGRDLAQALEVAALVERTAQMAWGALALGGIVPLPRRDRRRIAAHYQRRRAALANPATATRNKGDAMPILIAGTVDVAPEQRDAALQAGKPHMEATRGQRGCIHYQWGADPLTPGRIYVYEEWESQEALSAHFAGPHYRNMRECIGAHGLIAAEVSKFRVDLQEPVYDAQGAPRADFFSEAAGS